MRAQVTHRVSDSLPPAPCLRIPRKTLAKPNRLSRDRAPANALQDAMSSRQLYPVAEGSNHWTVHPYQVVSW